MLKFFHALFLLSFFAATATLAADNAYNQATFDTLLKHGKPTLVMIHADWCGSCKEQARTISELLNTPELRQITVLRVDFDQQKDVVKGFNASMQTTLIAFKNGKEVGRSTGDYKKDDIAALMKKAI